MKISEFSIKRPVTTAMIILVIILIGIVALTNLSLDLYPDITFPGAAIVTSYSGVGSEEIENLVTRPIESAVSTVEGVQAVRSTSAMGSSTVVVEFNWGRDMDFAVLDLREQIDMISGTALPDGADSPLVFKFDPAMIPIMVYGVSADGIGLAELKEETEDQLIPRLERTPGVAQVNLQGGLEREIIVSLKRERLNHYNLDYETIRGIIAQENVNVSAGDVRQGNRELLVRTIGKFSSIEEIRDVNIPVGERGFVKLSDIAEVEDGFADVQTISRTDGKESISLSIQKQTDANTVDVAEAVKQEMQSIQRDYPNYNFAVAFDQSEFIVDSINSVSRNAIIGGLLAVLILYLFLRNIRSTLIIATAMPVSIIATFVLMYFADVNLNVISLGGLALGVGMLVDNAVVVLENIYRYRSMGQGKIEAAREGSSEVGMAIVASTMTTVVVFLPIVFVEGLAGELFKDLALTVAFSLLASLLVALTLIPMLSSKILKITQNEIDRGKKEGKIRKKYRSLLTSALKRRWIIIGILLISLVGSLALLPGIGFEFIPTTDQGDISISYNLPVGTILSESDRAAAEIEEILFDIPEVETVIVNVGSANMMQTAASSHAGNFNVSLLPAAERDRTTVEVMEEIRQRVNIPDLEINVSEQTGPGGGDDRPVNVRLRGDNLEILEREIQRAVLAIEDVEGLVEIEDSFDEGRPELHLKVDRALSSRFGLNVNQIANTVRSAVSGDVASRYEVDGDEYDIRVRLEGEQIESSTQLEDLTIRSPNGNMIPLNRLVRSEITEGPAEILRRDQERFAEITADIEGRDLGSVVGDIQQRLNEIELPEGYRFTYEGEFEDTIEAFQSLIFAFALAAVLVYMVMASQFESLVHPFTIMFTIPMAIIGVILGLFISGSIISVPSFLGLITLSGIVVNNAIVMVDYINQLRRRGQDKIEAIINAATIRLRPIMMTALTTILALLPIAFGIGEGAEATQPMGVVIVSGLSFATFLTLFVIPIVYSLLTDLREIVIAKLKGIDREEASKYI
ncbi:efflux RND transporter permease subunit [Halanaerobium sp. Z-7514]|uniref:Efflux RND transporter permease subunit n=1 Tax=Halanaerobium polyolivorans TaxID=2886943 RepID=A0AAW4WTK9_9FIRM|nr:efflux RND transporter permease subunit [Halanaerobium polyolivorans]MCC3144430.1 efflux RND transporter permease subunit [Halanaerobium polyolivorans]RQD69858.1 MAG: efflux RND transporter permease subunit [Halanaerobium sp. MSAO_Bac5]